MRYEPPEKARGWFFLPSPLRGRGVGGEGQSLRRRPLTPNPSPPEGRGENWLLPRAHFDDQLLAEFAVLGQPRIDVGPRRQPDQPAFRRLRAGDLQEVRDRLRVILLVQLDQLDALAWPFLTVTVSPALSKRLGMSHVLPLSRTWPWPTSCRAAARDGAKPSRCTTLSRRRSRMRQQHLAGVLGRTLGQREITAELLLEDAVEALELLLFAQADAVFARLAAAVRACPAAMLRSRSIGALGASQRLPLRYSLMPSRRHSWQTGSRLRPIIPGSGLGVCGFVVYG